MAQKSKTVAARSTHAGKTSTKSSKPKSAAKSAPVKKSSKPAASPAPKVKVSPSKPASPAKVTNVKSAAAKPVEANSPAPQIAKAKAALKKASREVTSPVKKPEGKARARKIAIDINPNEAASALTQKWSTLFKKAEQIESQPYNMTNVFEEKTAITHKVLGWGYILANRNDRLEVLFKDGIKYLISNYKP